MMKTPDFDKLAQAIVLAKGKGKPATYRRKMLELRHTQTYKVMQRRSRRSQYYWQIALRHPKVALKYKQLIGAL
jgi:nucleoid-associated protein YgaU